MNRIVFDASAILVLLNQEPGADKLMPLVAIGAASAVNLAEVQGKLVKRGMEADQAWKAARITVREVIGFTEEQARIAGSLVIQTNSLGLSLGDRACLTLGILLNAPVYTADRLWGKLKLNIPIHVIR